MYYIYCYINKINGHKYVGQTNNLKRRIREHRSCALNPKSSSYNDLIHSKMRQYGIDNFEIEVLEQIYTDDINIVNEREQFWIKEKNSFRGDGEGYNSDLGGGSRIRNSILSQDQIASLKKEIQEGIPYYELEQKYNISASFISSINNGLYFYDKNQDYPLYKYYKDDSDYDELIELLTNSTLSLAEIAKYLDMGYSTVKKINAGTLKNGLYPTYPIRKRDVRAMRADKIKDALLHTDMTYQEIIDLYGSSKETIRRINIGESFKDDNLVYPLRNL